MAVNINRSFKLYGWCSRIRGIESGGAVEGLPTHTFPTDDGGVDMKCPTEIAISDRREAELAENGFMPLMHKKNTDFAAFIGAQSLHKPAAVRRPGRDRERQPGGAPAVPVRDLPLRPLPEGIVRDKIGSFKERADMQPWLQEWITQYVHGDPRARERGEKAEKPLAAAEVDRRGRRGQPRLLQRDVLPPSALPAGRPDRVSLRLVSKLKPAAAKRRLPAYSE